MKKSPDTGRKACALGGVDGTGHVEIEETKSASEPWIRQKNYIERLSLPIALAKENTRTTIAGSKAPGPLFSRAIQSAP